MNHIENDDHEHDGMSCGPICTNCSGEPEPILVCSICKQERRHFYNDTFFLSDEGNGCCVGGDIEQGFHTIEVFCELVVVITSNQKKQFRLKCPSCGLTVGRSHPKTGRMTTWNLKHAEVEKVMELYNSAYEDYALNEMQAGNKPVKRSAFLDWDKDPARVKENASLGMCSVVGCSNTDTELHHFYPQAVAEIVKGNREYASDWPTALLCGEHHDQWHNEVNPGQLWPNGIHKR